MSGWRLWLLLQRTVKSACQPFVSTFKRVVSHPPRLSATVGVVPLRSFNSIQPFSDSYPEFVRPLRCVTPHKGSDIASFTICPTKTKTFKADVKYFCNDHSRIKGKDVTAYLPGSVWCWERWTSRLVDGRSDLTWTVWQSVTTGYGVTVSSSQSNAVERTWYHLFEKMIHTHMNKTGIDIDESGWGHGELWLVLRSYSTSTCQP